MALVEDRWPDNSTASVTHGGRRVSFYVDIECIVCRVCADAAPNNFRLSEAEDHDICFKQPETPQELEACDEAMANCPVEAIGCDG